MLPLDGLSFVIGFFAFGMLHNTFWAVKNTIIYFREKSFGHGHMAAGHCMIAGGYMVAMSLIYLTW